jgi:hypothetical protein
MLKRRKREIKRFRLKCDMKEFKKFPWFEESKNNKKN